jgi:hypothetical protein
MNTEIANRLAELRSRIGLACQNAGRSANEVTIIGVTKTHPTSLIREAVAAGITQIGENRIQEAEPKIRELGSIARWHMIGHLQTNKVKKAVELFDVIQSVDSIRLAEEINKRAGEIGKKIECFVEVNSSGETAKSGIAPVDAIELIRQIQEMPNIRLTGLMTVGPLTDNETEIRRAFALCRNLFNEGRAMVGEQFCNLSMGMSDDFELAIAEGTTMIRIGSLLFGRRE